MTIFIYFNHLNVLFFNCFALSIDSILKFLHLMISVLVSIINIALYFFIYSILTIQFSFKHIILISKSISIAPNNELAFIQNLFFRYLIYFLNHLFFAQRWNSELIKFLIIYIFFIPIFLNYQIIFLINCIY
jgi:hypothetical protein